MSYKYETKQELRQDVRGKEIREVMVTGTMTEAREVEIRFTDGGKLIFTPTNYQTVEVSS